MKVVLCVGGLDPAGRAGLLADVRAVEAMGARAVVVAAAITYQSSRRVDGYFTVPADVLRAQLAPILRDEPIAAVKLGQLGSAENAGLLAQLLPDVPLVVDTPLVSSSGAALFDAPEPGLAYAPLFARATLVTPNAPEALALAGVAATEDRATTERAARGLGASVLLKGGHLSDDPARVTDVLLAAGRRVEFASVRIDGRFRGTGCRFASAIAARLAQGETLEAAIGAAREWLEGRLRAEA